MKSSGVSFIPPLPPLVRGVRIANVMAISSGFFWVLEVVSKLQALKAGKKAYIADNPLLPGVRWLRIELSRSEAMMLGEGELRMLEQWRIERVVIENAVWRRR